MTITWGLFFTILLMVTLAALGHSVWHAEAISVMNFLTHFFAGGHAVG